MNYVRHTIVVVLGAVKGWLIANTYIILWLYRDWILTVPLACCLGLVLEALIQRLSFPPALYSRLYEEWQPVKKYLPLYLLLLISILGFFTYLERNTTPWIPKAKGSIPTFVIVLANTLGPLYGAFGGSERVRHARRKLQELEREPVAPAA